MPERITGEGSLLEIAGILPDEEADALRDTVEERRKRRGRDLDAVVDELHRS